MEIRPVGAELFHANRHIKAQTDMTTIKVALRNFANAPMNSSTIKCKPKHLNEFTYTAKSYKFRPKM
jgi:hypothetical protein